MVFFLFEDQMRSGIKIHIKLSENYNTYRFTYLKVPESGNQKAKCQWNIKREGIVVHFGKSNEITIFDPCSIPNVDDTGLHLTHNRQDKILTTPDFVRRVFTKLIQVKSEDRINTAFSSDPLEQLQII